MFTLLTETRVRVEHIPAHKYVEIWDIDAADYGSFWSRHDCNSICGIIDSMSHVSHPIVTCHTAGWFTRTAKGDIFTDLACRRIISATIRKGSGTRFCGRCGEGKSTKQEPDLLRTRLRIEKHPRIENPHSNASAGFQPLYYTA